MAPGEPTTPGSASPEPSNAEETYSDSLGPDLMIPKATRPDSETRDVELRDPVSPDSTNDVVEAEAIAPKLAADQVTATAELAEALARARIAESKLYEVRLAEIAALADRDRWHGEYHGMKADRDLVNAERARLHAALRGRRERVARWVRPARRVAAKAISVVRRDAGPQAADAAPQVAPAPLLTLPVAEQPWVSIVIPVHGQWEYTLRCLRSLVGGNIEASYEVIVVDDASPDDTLERLGEVEGVRVVAQQPNVGYVGACNLGIEAARGEFVLLLNNDTEVHPGAVDALVRTFDLPGVGLVGARLVYPDGRLQEAGGIVYADASGANYGRLDDPEAFPYTYLRDVDYCSGAAIMVRRAVLETLGGLDTRFAPAYYDDTDLAFAVRDLGLRTLYQPTATVTHFEGISHGTDTGSGVKAYQEVNKQTFAAKWAAALERQPDPATTSHAAAARRPGAPRGTVVVIDRYVPRPDEDSGSVRMAGLLHSLRRLGYGVIFVPHDRVRSEQYAAPLQADGIEVFYGHDNLLDFLTQLSGDLVAVVLSRIDIAVDYLLDLRRALVGVPIFFDTVDLHFLREQRAAELAGEGETALVTSIRELELATIRSSDVTLVVSPVEQRYLAEIEPEAPVAVVSNVHEVDRDRPIDLSGRQSLIFVGSFAHQPNSDGMVWFLNEVLPLIDKEVPGVAVDIVGKDAGHDLIEAAGERATLHGWVEDLGPLYEAARVAIAPLRYGAGVKGKIGEAMAWGVPVVTTDVGAEGMDLVDGETAFVRPDPAGFATAVVSLLTDDGAWQAMARAGLAHIDRVLGVAAFDAALGSVLADYGRNRS